MKLLPKLLLPVNDGIDHINIYSRGKTKLGRFLTNMNDTPVNTEHGEFKSAESYWHWLKLHSLSPSPKLEIFRTLSSFESHQLSRKMMGVADDGIKSQISAIVTSEVFRNHIKNMITNKIKDNPQFLSLFRDNKVPYTHYYYYGSIDYAKVIPLPQYDWIPQFLNDLEL